MNEVTKYPGHMPPNEARTSRFVFPQDVNTHKTLFGGTAIAWMDSLAGIAAKRWCHQQVVTAHIGHVDFGTPIHEGALVEMAARVVKTGRTSMDVNVQLYDEALDGTQKLCIEALFIMVAIGENFKPVPVPKMED